MANIDDFKASLIGGGARANQFRVTITPPSGIAIGLDTRRTSFLVKAAALPSRTITEIPLKFRGRTIFMAGVVSPSDYQTDLTVEQLDRDETVLKTYILRNCWPTTSGSAIELSMESESAVEEFSVSWRYQHFEASGVNF